MTSDNWERPTPVVPPCWRKYRAEIERAMTKPISVESGGFNFISSEVAVRLRRRGGGYMLDVHACLITRQLTDVATGEEWLEGRWIVDDRNAEESR